ncbi:UNVERIFIED_CONTAM: hypothetical protein PYX00_004142 [Menopon gallinae]|uniref:Fibronectin type 3 and ankyrin repeat domains protein 1 n=1 Tax=Menopon gallinae TaxID=328185 RepID=A0AAW2I316_9NEOP
MERTLRATASTRHSITVSWAPAGPSPKSPEEETAGSEEPGTEDGRDQGPVYVLQMYDRLFGWITVYSGFGTETEVKNLKPGDCFRFRLKTSSNGVETGWNETLVAATEDEAVPLGHLLRAVSSGNAATIKKITAQRPSLMDVPNKFSQTPLEVAIANGDVNTVALLLNCGADLAKPEIGSWRTPLMIAAFHGHLEIVKLLAGKRRSWEDRDRSGMTALHYAADNSHLEIVKFAVEDGAPVDARDVYGWSPLMRAVILKASREVIEYLLENGGDVSDTDGRGQTLLMQAVLSGRPDTVKLIASKTTDFSVRNAVGRTARDMAACSATEEIRNMASTLGGDDDQEEDSENTEKRRPTTRRRSGEDLLGAGTRRFPFPTRGCSGPPGSRDRF